MRRHRRPSRQLSHGQQCLAYMCKPFAAAMDGVCDRWGSRSAHVATFSSGTLRVRALSAMSRQCVSLATRSHPYSSPLFIPPDRERERGIGHEVTDPTTFVSHMTCSGSACASAHMCTNLSWCDGTAWQLNDSLATCAPRGCMASSPLRPSLSHHDAADRKYRTLT